MRKLQYPVRFRFNRKKLTRGQQRLLKLADMTEKLPAVEFDMGTVFEDCPDGDPDCGSGPAKTCGSVGCVIGWAAHKKLFRQLTVSSGGYVNFNGSYMSFSGRSTGAEELSEFLGLDVSSDVPVLFGGLVPRYDCTPAAKAYQLRLYVWRQRKSLPGYDGARLRHAAIVR